MGQVFEGLTVSARISTPSRTGRVRRGAPDGTTWTFKLRPGVKFHNGKEMTAADVKASLERWRKVGPKGTASTA